MPVFPEAPVRGDWTDARVDKLRELWREGLSASAVAARLGVSRNAVIGKVHRLGLSKSGEHDLARPKPVRPSRPKAPRRVARVERKAAPRQTPQVLQASIDLPGLVDRLEALGAQGCHFPVGDPQAADVAFCGRLRSDGPYCEAHRQIAYQPGGPKPVSGLIRRYAGGIGGLELGLEPKMEARRGHAARSPARVRCRPLRGPGLRPGGAAGGSRASARTQPRSPPCTRHTPVSSTPQTSTVSTP